MPPIERTRAWVTFFKALADENRLKIVGLLAHQPHSVEEIAALLHISPATASHHLQRLLAADLVEARALQYYNVYALRPGTLRQMAEQLATLESLKETAQAIDFDGYATLVLKDYVVRGRLKAIPSQVRKRQVILLRLADEFEIGKRYPERKVNQILKSFHADYATLRRLMVEAGLLSHSNGFYWRETA
jgi:biotin operon repressor